MNYSLIIASTFNKNWFQTDEVDAEDSSIYYHFKNYKFPADYGPGEYRYYVMPFCSGYVLENNKVYLDGEEVLPFATGLIQYGAYERENSYYTGNNEKKYIEYEG